MRLPPHNTLLPILFTKNRFPNSSSDIFSDFNTGCIWAFYYRHIYCFHLPGFWRKKAVFSIVGSCSLKWFLATCTEWLMIMLMGTEFMITIIRRVIDRPYLRNTSSHSENVFSKIHYVKIERLNFISRGSFHLTMRRGSFRQPSWHPHQLEPYQNQLFTPKATYTIAHKQIQIFFGWTVRPFRISIKKHWIPFSSSQFVTGWRTDNLKNNRLR